MDWNIGLVSGWKVLGQERNDLDWDGSKQNKKRYKFRYLYMWSNASHILYMLNTCKLIIMRIRFFFLSIFLALSFSLSFSLFLSLYLSRSFILSIFLALSFSLSFSLFLSLYLSRSFFLSIFLALSFSLSFSLFLSLYLSRSFFLSISIALFFLSLDSAIWENALVIFIVLELFLERDHLTILCLWHP